MGTKLEHAINVLAASPNSSNFGNCVAVLDCLHNRVLIKDLQITGLHKLNGKMPDNNKIDAIKKTMQMHEDIFKYQVQELHRLYRVQRMLMDELKREIKQKNRKHWSPMNCTSNHSQFTNQHNSITIQSSCGYAHNVQLSRDDNISRERSGGCSDKAMMRVITRDFDLERRPAAEEETGEVELTLSIGVGTNKKMYKSYRPLDHFQEFGFPEAMHKNINYNVLDRFPAASSLKSQSGEGFSGPATLMSSSNATIDQKRKVPLWIFQGLSII